MRNAIFEFEIRSWLKAPILYIFLFVCFAFPFVTMLGSGGYFDGSISTAKNVHLLNSPYQLVSISFLITKLFLLIVAVVAGLSLYRDYHTNTHAILFTLPISKSYFLNGKFGSVVLLLSIFCLVAFAGIYLGTLLLEAGNPRIGQQYFSAYLLAFGLYVLPTVLFIAVLVFVIVGWSRNIFAGLVTVICLLLFQAILENTLFEQRTLLAILDPFAQNAFYLTTQNWNFEQQNASILPLSNWVLWNRGFWLLIASILYLLFLRNFNFQFSSGTALRIRWKRQSQELVQTNFWDEENLEKITYDFSTLAKLQATWYLAKHHFFTIVKNWIFVLLSIFGAFTVFFIQLKASQTGEFVLLPLTRIFIGAPLTIYILIVIFSTFLFSGFLTDQPSRYRVNTLIDATSVEDWQLQWSKIGAISLIQLVQLLIFLLISLSIQLINGYYHFQLELYLFHLFVLVFPLLLIWNVTSHFVHSLFSNLFLSLFCLAGLWLSSQAMEQIGISTILLQYNTLPNPSYSDFHGYGHPLYGYLWLLLYWMVWGAILLLLTKLLWRRGKHNTILERWQLVKSRWNKSLAILLSILIVSFCVLAFFLHQAEQAQLSQAELNLGLERYKNGWQKYVTLPQPKITTIELQIDVSPKTRSFVTSGSYQLVNKSNRTIDTILLRTGFDENTTLDWKEEATLVKQDTFMKSYLYRLATPLQALDTLKLGFKVTNTQNTLFSRNSNVLSDGTYLKQDILPRVGYQFTKHELPLTDSLVNCNNYYHRDADYANMRTRISTDQPQMVIAPGNLRFQAKKEDKIIQEYVTPIPVKINFSFHAAAYEIIETKHQSINIQCYHKEGYTQNVEMMITGVKAALDYLTAWLGAYPYQEIRIIEFPDTEDAYAATLTTNNIPVSELLFNLNTRVMSDNINLPFYVLAHELTHEWFGNQLMPADAEGARMLTESIAEYLSLRIYESHFGQESVAQILALQEERYAVGSKKERGEESALYQVRSHQKYLFYGKGAIAFYNISEAIGQEKFNLILKAFFEAYRLPSDSCSYPTTLDFITFLKARTDTAKQNVIDNWLMIEDKK